MPTSNDNATKDTHESGFRELLKKAARTKGFVSKEKEINGNVTFTEMNCF